MRNRLCSTALLISAYALVTAGRLITAPLNQLVWPSFFNITMTCSSTRGSSAITWFLTPVGATDNITIASGSQVNQAFAHLYWLNQSMVYQSNLVIRTANESVCGTFACSDNEMIGHAQLTMWRYLISPSNVSNNLIIGDVIRHTFQAFYFGNPLFYPIFYLKSYPDNMPIANITSSQLEKLNSTVMATATFDEIASCPSYQRIYCVIGFGQPLGSLLPGSATSASEGGATFAFDVANVSCVPSITGLLSGAVLYSGAMLTCDLTSKLPVNYSWTELKGGTSGVGPKLNVWKGGSYKCTASLNVAGQWQSVSTTVYNLTVENLSITANPLYGPIAGGTNITLTLDNWSKRIPNISAVYLSGILKLQSYSVGNTVVVTTTSAASSLIGQPFPITVQVITGPQNLSTNLSFTYKGNAEITGISPSTFVVTGGQAVTATGIQLSSVANPFIQVTIVVERGIVRKTTTEKSLQPCEVNVADGNAMICRMPSVNIPDDFLKVLDSKYSNRSKRDTNFLMNQPKPENPILLSRHKRYANALSLSGPNGVDQLIISLGFILDGYKKYENINDVLPDTQILMFSPPEINFTTDIVKFDEGKEEVVTIKGNFMTRGCRITDYVVQVGTVVCENIDLTDNELRCRMPKTQPQSTQNISNYCDQLPSINIRLGFQTYQYACMKYSARPSSTQTALIIGLVVGLSALVIVVVLVTAIVFFCCKKSRNLRNKSNNNYTLNSNTDGANAVYRSPSDHQYDYPDLRPSTQSDANKPHDYLDLRPSTQSDDNKPHDYLDLRPSTQSDANKPNDYLDLRPSTQSYANN